MPLGNDGIVRLVKYCVILEKYANYPTPLKMSTRRTNFGFNLVIVCGKLKRRSPKITSMGEIDYPRFATDFKFCSLFTEIHS